MFPVFMKLRVEWGRVTGTITHSEGMSCSPACLVLKCSSPAAAWFRGTDSPPGGHEPWPGRGAATFKVGGSGEHDGGQLSLTCPEAQKEAQARDPGPHWVPGTEWVLYISSVT